MELLPFTIVKLSGCIYDSWVLWTVSLWPIPKSVQLLVFGDWLYFNSQVDKVFFSFKNLILINILPENY